MRVNNINSKNNVTTVERNLKKTNEPTYDMTHMDKFTWQRLEPLFTEYGFTAHNFF